jgi:hypothetical protein
MKLQPAPVMILVLTLAAHAQAQTRVLRAVGVVEMGPNTHCGAPIWSLSGIPVGPESRGEFLGLTNTNAGRPVTISSNDCDGTTGRLGDPVVTKYDDGYGVVRGWTAPNLALEDLTLNDIPVPAGNGVRAPIPFPGGVPPNPLPATRRIPTEAATLSGWLSASGDLEITCDDVANTAVVASSMQNLIPNAVYTMWAHWTDPVSEVLATPFGDLPNVIVTDASGNAEFCRELVYCPLDLAPDGSEIQFLSLSYMGDGVAYGAVPYEATTTRAFVGILSLPFISTIPGGIISFDHLGFRINATDGPDAGSTSPAMCLGPAPTVASSPPGGFGLIWVLGATGAYALFRRYREASASH